MNIPIINQKIILDSCILQYINNPTIEPELTRVFNLLKNQKNKFYFSDFSTYEIFNCCPIKKEVGLTKIWKNFPRYQVNQRVTRFASDLSTAYKVNKIPITSISVGDKIIGATAMLTKSFILTSNENDFPRPFFKEVYIHDVLYKTKKGKNNLIQFYFLNPSVSTFSHYFSKRTIA